MSQVRLVPIAFKMSSLFVCSVLIHSAFGVDTDPETLPEKATTAGDNDSRNVTLKISLTPDSESIVLGSTTTLTCTINPEEDVEKIWWTKDGTNVTTSEMQDLNSATTIDVIMDSESDAGNYTCVAKTTNGTARSKTVRITSLPNYQLEIIVTPEKCTAIKGGEETLLTCNIRPEGGGQQVWWMHDGKNLSNPDNTYSSATTVVKMISEDDAGNYSCIATTKNANNPSLKKTIGITLIPEPGRVIEAHGGRVESSATGVMSCELAGFPLRNFTWRKIDDAGRGALNISANISHENATLINMTLKLDNVTRKDNGTYQCSAQGSDGTIISGYCDFIVVDVPEVKPDFIKAVGESRVYLNWTVTDWNDNVTNYFVEYAKNGADDWEKYSEKIAGKNSNLVVKGLEKSTGYEFRISANNSIGTSPHRSYSKKIKTLERDSKFKLTARILEKIDDGSIEISWKAEPSDGLKDFVQYYKIIVSNGIDTEEYTCPVEGSNIYKFHNLGGELSEYQFRVATYSNYTQEYGDFSKPIKFNMVINGGMPGYPSPVDILSYFILLAISRLL